MQKQYNESLINGRALFGGSFDPIHCGHIAVAQSVLNLETIDEVVFIPNAVSPLKSHNPLATNNERKEMIHNAIQGIEGFILDDSELERGGISYTIDTVEAYREKDNSDLYFIMGADQFYQLPDWHRAEDLIKELKFLIYPREGYSIAAAPLASNKAIAYEVLNLPYWNMSSTKIRKLCEQGESIEKLVPQSVEGVIDKYQIYQKFK